jgi:hypothetical protein
MTCCVLVSLASVAITFFFFFSKISCFHLFLTVWKPIESLFSFKEAFMQVQ